MTGYHYQVLCGIRRYAVGFSHWRWQGITPDNSALAALAQWRPHGVGTLAGQASLQAMGYQFINMDADVLALTKYFQNIDLSP